MFKGRLALNPGLNLTSVSISFVQKHFLGQFSRIFIEHRIINLLTKRIKLTLLYKLSQLNSNFALTLGYLNPTLNNPALGDIMLLCGDIHPQPGRFQPAKGDSKKIATEDNKQSTEQTRKNKTISCPSPILTFVLWQCTKLNFFQSRPLVT